VNDPRGYDLMLKTAEIPIAEAASTASLVKTRHSIKMG
jgi:hypothetical protein